MHQGLYRFLDAIAQCLRRLAFEGRLAYGFLFGDDTSAFDAESEPSGVYGNAKVQATFACIFAI